MQPFLPHTRHKMKSFDLQIFHSRHYKYNSKDRHNIHRSSSREDDFLCCLYKNNKDSEFVLRCMTTTYINSIVEKIHMYKRSCGILVVYISTLMNIKTQCGKILMFIINYICITCKESQCLKGKEKFLS